MSALTIKKMKKTANNVSNFPSTNAKKQFHLETISPITPAQTETFRQFKQGYNLILKGSAGTGKTFLSLYLALKSILTDSCDQTKIVVIRSAVPTRDIGALPGDLDEKTGIYELPYYSICHELTNNKNAYTSLKADNIISFVPTSYLRGVTFRNSIVIVDEFQNFNDSELYTTITRAGDNCRFIFCGDLRQNDLNKKNNDKSGYDNFLNIVSKMNSFRQIEFKHEDIVRSDIVKEFIIAHETC